MINSVYDISKAIPVRMGTIDGYIFGGPFRQFKPQHRVVGVKMAAEIPMACDVDIPTEDFSIPDEDIMLAGVIEALSMMALGQDVYVGCMGGIGRTGLFMGCVAKVLIEAHGGTYLGYTDPVIMVREIYKGHAIETHQQQEFVKDFRSDDVLKALNVVAVQEPEVQDAVADEGNEGIGVLHPEVSCSLWDRLWTRVRDWWSQRA